jgi:hypothetical protein
MVQSTAQIANNVLCCRKESERRAFADAGLLPTAADLEVARAALEWARVHFGAENVETRSDFDHNMFVATKGDTLTGKAMGLAAYAVAAYLKEQQRLLEAKLAAEAGASSVFMGEEGKSVDFRATAYKMRRIEGQFGTTYLYNFRTVEGNELVWFASTRPTDENGEGIEPSDKEFFCTGKVKAHKEFNRVKQTVVSRVTFWTPDARAAYEVKEAKKAAAAVKKAAKAAKVLVVA